MTLQSEFSTGSERGAIAPNPYAMDGGSEAHSYSDNARLKQGPVTSATNASKFGGNVSETHRQMQDTLLNKQQTLSFGTTSVDTTPSYSLGSIPHTETKPPSALDTPETMWSIPSSGSGAAAGAGITGAAGGGVA